MKELWIVIEHAKGIIDEVSLELLTGARQLSPHGASRVTAIILGDETIERLIELVKPYGPHRIIGLRNKGFAEYSVEAYVSGLSRLHHKYQASTIWAGHDSTGLDFLPRLAVQQNTGMISGCVDFKIENDRLFYMRSIYGGKLQGDVRALMQPVIVSFYPGSFTAEMADGNGDVEIILEDLDMAISSSAICIKNVLKPTSDDIDITKAEVIVSIGRGLVNHENVNRLMKPLSEGIAGIIAGSRSAVDMGLIPPSRQVGQSGKSVRPRVYIAVAISGAVQHVAGMKNSQTIIAINKDPNAPIFKYADYAIVDDLFEFVPLVLSELNAIKA